MKDSQKKHFGINFILLICGLLNVGLVCSEDVVSKRIHKIKESEKLILSNKEDLKNYLFNKVGAVYSVANSSSFLFDKATCIDLFDAFKLQKGIEFINPYIMGPVSSDKIKEFMDGRVEDPFSIFSEDKWTTFIASGATAIYVANIDNNNDNGLEYIYFSEDYISSDLKAPFANIGSRYRIYSKSGDFITEYNVGSHRSSNQNYKEKFNGSGLFSYKGKNYIFIFSTEDHDSEYKKIVFEYFYGESYVKEYGSCFLKIK